MKMILAQACCGPCATSLLDNGYTFLFNGNNFDSKQEYERRKSAMLLVDPKTITEPYNPRVFETCEDCIKHRLERTARYAKENGFGAFTTTLTVSPHKSSVMVNTIGQSVAKEIEIPFLELNLKKQNGFSKTIEKSKELGLYRQTYCGCAKSKFDLFKSLQEYIPFDATEKKHLESVIEFLNTNENQYERSNLSGHINGSAFLLNSDLTKTLLTHHKKLGKWLQFGGHSDGDKNTLGVAIRETREESGIKDFRLLKNEIFDIDIHSIPENKNKNEPEHLHYDIRFLFSTNNEEFEISDESNELRWVTMDEFSNLVKDQASQRFLKKWKLLKSLN